MMSVLAGGKIGGWCVSKMKSCLLLILVILLMMVCGIEGEGEGGCIEEERNALLRIKTSLIHSFPIFNIDPLPSWVDDGGECCNWERVTCNPTTGHVTGLSLSNMTGIPYFVYYACTRTSPSLNVSLFLHFKELTSLDLSLNCLDDGIVNTGLERLSSLKKLEILDLSHNYFGNETIPSLGGFTSLRVLHLGQNYYIEGYFPTLALENLEMLDLTGNYKMLGFEQISLLKKLKILNIGGNKFNDSLITSLSALPMLKSLDLSDNDLFRMSFLVEELVHLTNLEELDLSHNNMNDVPSIQECTRLSRLKRLKSLSLVDNNFNKNIISCLSALPSLKILHLSSNLMLGSSFPIQELVHLTSLEELDLSENEFNEISSIQGRRRFSHECTGLSRLKKLERITLADNNFNKSIISCLSALPSLKTLDLTLSLRLSEGSFPIQELSHLPHDLKVLLLRDNDFKGTLPIQALASHFHHLEVLDLSHNKFVGSIPSTIQELSSLKVLSFANNNLNGSLTDPGLCELKNLHELDLSFNMFDGSLPQCFNRLSSLKFLDISSNQFTGLLTPSPIANLTSLEYVDFGNNAFEGSFLFSSFANNTKLEVVRFTSNNNKFEVETEEPTGWISMFQLKILVLSGCNINRQKGSVVPGFLLHQRMLHVIDLSENSMVGKFPNWLIENNTMLGALILRKNSFSGIIYMLHINANTRWLDMSQNHINGSIPDDIHKFYPYLTYLNLSSNFLNGVMPSSISYISSITALDLSDNELSGEVPVGLLEDYIPSLQILRLSKNRLHGQVLSGNLRLGNIKRLHLDNNFFNGEIKSGSNCLKILDISNNSFIGTIPVWISNSDLSELVVSNNRLEGPFPCGTASYSFLDISQNSFSGPIPSCLNFQVMRHLHLGSNRFTGSIPNVFRNLTNVLTLDVGNNFLSGRIPKFLGDLSNLRVLILRKNNFSGFIPKQLCILSNMSLIDLSSNSLSGSIPSCLQNITTPIYPTFIPDYEGIITVFPYYYYRSVLQRMYFDTYSYDLTVSGTQDKVQFTTKTLSLVYEGNILDYMVGLDLSCNKLTGDIPQELGLLIEIRALNLSHNLLFGPFPSSFSNLANIESLDLSSNNLSGEVPSQLIQLNYLSAFNVSYNNLSGKLPDMKAQFSTFTKESYEGNPLLCGPPLKKKCTSTSPVTDPSTKEGVKDAGSDKWYDIDMVSFYGSSGSTWVVFLLGYIAVLYINPYWRKRWLDLVEECMYAFYYFLEDSVRKVSKVFRK